MGERKSLLHRLKNDQVDIDRVLNLCIRILDGSWTFFDDAFLKSEYAIMSTTFQRAYYSVLLDEDNDVDHLLDFCDLVYTVLHKCKASYKGDQASQVLKILNNALNQLGYDVRKTDDSCYECYRKDLKAEAIASAQPETIKDKIYAYLSIRDGNEKEKRITLKSLIDEVELFCQKRASIKEIDKTKQFYQCVRHTKNSPKKEFPFYYKDEEKWLDFIFQMVIDVLSFEDLEKRVIIVIDEEKRANQ